MGKEPRRSRYRLRKTSRAVTPDEVDSGSKTEPDELRLDRAALRFFGRPRRMLISEAAYYRSQRTETDPVSSWLDSEKEIDRLLRSRLRRGEVESGEGSS